MEKKTVESEESFQNRLSNWRSSIALVTVALVIAGSCLSFSIYNLIK